MSITLNLLGNLGEERERTERFGDLCLVPVTGFVELNSTRKESWKTCEYSECKQEMDFKGSFQIQTSSS